MSRRRAYRGDFLHCVGDPTIDAEALRLHADHVLVVEDGVQHALMPWASYVPHHEVELHAWPGKLIVPGFVDTHIHFPQVDVIASHGAQLLDWLERYTFPAEARFADPAVARAQAEFFIERLIEHGTTTALVFATVHPGSVDALFDAAEPHGMALVAGKVLMDRHAPDALLDTPERAREESETLIMRWHGHGRFRYAVTPRFAPTSTAAQLEVAGDLLAAHPDVYLHTHLAENQAECRWVAELFPEAHDYLAVYERFRLVGRRSLFAHGIWLDDSARRRLATAGAALSHCPCSNLALGSGLFDLEAARRAGIRTGLGSDIGGGDSYSLLRVVNEAYKVQQLQQATLSPGEALWLATLGGAEALGLDDEIGSFTPGKFADFVVLDPHATPVLSRRWQIAADPLERLFSLLMLGDDRHVTETVISGRPRKHGRIARSICRAAG